jgi:hypothetical protein
MCLGGWVEKISLALARDMSQIVVNMVRNHRGFIKCMEYLE